MHSSTQIFVRPAAVTTLNLVKFFRDPAMLRTLQTCYLVVFGLTLAHQIHDPTITHFVGLKIDMLLGCLAALIGYTSPALRTYGRFGSLSDDVDQRYFLIFILLVSGTFFAVVFGFSWVVYSLFGWAFGLTMTIPKARQFR